MRPNNGNILFLLLLAIVLFAALGYAVTSALRGGGKDSSSESAKAAAASVLQHMTLIKNEVGRIMLVNGCKMENLDIRTYDYETIGGSSLNSFIPTQPKTGCALFHDFGGPLNTTNFAKYAAPGFSGVNTTFKAGHFSIRFVTQINNGTDAAEVALLVYGLREDICRYMINMDNPPDAIPSDGFTFSSYTPDTPPTHSGTSRVGDDPLNLGDYFATMHIASGGSVAYCLIGTAIIPR